MDTERKKEMAYGYSKGKEHELRERKLRSKHEKSFVSCVEHDADSDIHFPIVYTVVR